MSASRATVPLCSFRERETESERHCAGVPLYGVQHLKTWAGTHTDKNKIMQVCHSIPGGSDCLLELLGAGGGMPLPATAMAAAAAAAVLWAAGAAGRQAARAAIAASASAWRRS